MEDDLKNQSIEIFSELLKDEELYKTFLKEKLRHFHQNLIKQKIYLILYLVLH